MNGRDYYVVEVVRYRITAESKHDACERITNDPDRNSLVVDVDDRFAYPVKDDEARDDTRGEATR